MDSIRIAKLVNELKQLPADSLTKVTESVRRHLPDSVRRAIFNEPLRDSLALDSLAKDTTLTERQRL